MRSGAWPTTRIPRTCRLRARREPPINPPIIATGPESGLGPLENHSTCHPRAWPIARTEGERRRPRQRPPAPGPPIFAIPLERGGPGGRGLEYVGPSNPCPSCSLHFVMAERSSKNTYQTNHRRTPRPRGGGMGWGLGGLGGWGAGGLGAGAYRAVQSAGAVIPRPAAAALWAAAN